MDAATETAEATKLEVTKAEATEAEAIARTASNSKQNRCRVADPRECGGIVRRH
jgi:hypothetical protein